MLFRCFHAELRGTFISGDDLEKRIINEIAAYMPRELLINVSSDTLSEVTAFVRERIGGTVDDRRCDYFEYNEAQLRIKDIFGKTSQEIGAETPQSVCALGAMLRYLEETYCREIPNIKDLRFYSEDQYMQIDSGTRRNLELCQSMRDGEKRGTLLWVLDRTRTSMGARLLRRWIEKPLRNAAAISARQDAAAQLATTICCAGSFPKRSARCRIWSALWRVSATVRRTRAIFWR